MTILGLDDQGLNMIRKFLSYVNVILFYPTLE